MFGRLMPRRGQVLRSVQRACRADRARAAKSWRADGEPRRLERRAHTTSNRSRSAPTRSRTRPIELLHKTFITPLDRDDIHQLITRMDDILDLMEDAAADRLPVRRAGGHARGASASPTSASLRRESPGGGRPAAQHGQRPTRSSSSASEIDRLESEADHVMRAAMAQALPRRAGRARADQAARTSTSCSRRHRPCEDVANIIEGIVLENA